MDINVESGKALNFLHYIRDNGYIGLTAIRPDGSLESITRCVKDKKIEAFIRKHNNNDGLYYTLNEPYDSAPNSKLKKEHIKSLYGIYIDADPDKSKPFHEERKRLLEFAKNLNNDTDFPPTLIIDSGGGIQALWLFEKPIPATPVNVKAVEDYGRGLAKKYNTDSVQNIDRLLRLPFTLNIPNDLKKATGRTNALATVLYASQKRYSSLKGICTPIEAKIHEGVIDHNHDFDFDSLEPDGSKIPEELKKRMDAVVRMDEKLRALTTGKLKRNSRSDYDFAYASRLKAAGFNIQDTAQIMYILPNGKGEELTERDIVRCYDRADDPFNNLKLDNDYILKINSIPNPMIQLAAPKEVKTILNSQRLYKAAGEMSWKKSGIPLLKGLIDQGTVVAIYGQSNVGKSFITADIVAHIADGKSWAGHRLRKRGSVIVAAAESGATYGKRVDAIKIRLGHKHDVSLQDFPFAVIDTHINLLETDSSGVCSGIEMLVLEAQRVTEDSGYPCKVIVIDTLSAVMGGANENSSDDMGKVMDNLLILAKRTGATVIIVHHSGKDQAAGLRGHTKLIGGIDTSLEVKLTSVGSKERRELVARKQRDNDMSGSIEFNLNVVVLGIDSDGDEVTSCNIRLESDSEFTSVIPDKTIGLPVGQQIAYKMVAMAQYTSNYDIQQMYGWYYYIEQHITIALEELQRRSESGTHVPLIRPSSGLVKPNSVREQCVSLRKKGYIEKNLVGQWVTV